MNGILYFAYGSNMSQRRLRARVSSSEPVGIAVLAHHMLAFHKAGMDGSGKCNIVAGDGEVYGVVFEMPESGLLTLDRFEGPGYERRTVTVEDSSGRLVQAYVYVAIKIDPDILPYTWYKRHVLEGAREARLPAAYLQLIASIEAIEDPDTDRARRELAIYGDSSLMPTTPAAAAHLMPDGNGTEANPCT